MLPAMDASRSISVILTVSALTVSLFTGCAHTPRETLRMQTPPADAVSHLVILKNDTYVVGFLPRIGGRVVLFRRVDGPNVLLSDPDCWDDTDEEIPAAAPDSGWKSYNGHTVWVGPQSGFWTQQDLNAERRDKQSTWPPDPYLIYGKYELAEKTDTYARLVGPLSPVCGLQLTKEVWIENDAVRVRVEAVNIRKDPVSWDLWSNTRLPGYASAYVPVDKETQMKLEHDGSNPIDRGMLPYEVHEGFFTFTVLDKFPGNWTQRTSKAFINKPSAGVLIGIHGGDCFVKRCEITPKVKVHPAQAFIEIYQDAHRAAAPGLLELEVHGEYRTLQPGDSMALEETWQIIAYPGGASVGEHLRFLQQHGLSR